MGTPLKFDSSPPRNGGWKTTFLLGRWLFQGRAVKLRKVNEEVFRPKGDIMDYERNWAKRSELISFINRGSCWYWIMTPVSLIFFQHIQNPKSRIYALASDRGMILWLQHVIGVMAHLPPRHFVYRTRRRRSRSLRQIPRQRRWPNWPRDATSLSFGLGWPTFFPDDMDGCFQK